ncbi:unnamed protein product [Rhizoctonia solani]|uniref:Zn(2)-C6 fungal-type domain-containing protein n=1 Tax=Rhizoctonia solani TaxID=456999 RepID=A0A8H2WQZ9_9AGAM|nr:unnamed protein product [Rhizoctonia solani]CAE6460721.1 unnamed protein product [Rhizoctonia solani]
MTSTRSTTGCLACKTKRKKCDEAKPHCLRCQKSHIECPGYTYLHDPNKPNRKPRTLPAPRTRVGKSRVTVHAETSLADTEAYGQKQGYSPIAASSSAMDIPVVGSSRTPSEVVDILNQRTSLPSFSGSLQLPYPSVDFSTSRHLAENTTDPYHAISPPSGVAKALTAGQASLLEALLSLAQPLDVNSPSKHAETTTELPQAASIALNSNCSPPEIQSNSSIESHEDDDLEDFGTGDIFYRLALDRTTESNALPFILQSYAKWVSRMAFEPQKLTGIARDFVFGHFGDGDESRWIIALLANVGSRIGSADLLGSRPNRMISMLQNAVRLRLGAVKSRPHSDRVELIKALDCTLEAMVIHCSVSPFSEVQILIQEAAPIFRQLCPESLNLPINLTSLLQHGLGCLRHFAEIEIVFCIFTETPTLFRYEVALSSSESSYHYQSVPAKQGDGIVQWLHGVPNEIILLFAKMKTMRQDGSKPNGKTIESLEGFIREIQPFDGPSTERFVTIMRSVVQECWRQAAYIYLYMAVCGDPCNTSRVKEAYKRFMKLLKGTKPGRLPDEFLIAPLLIISPAVQQQRDREVIRQRVLGLQRPGQTVRANVHVICIVEDYWARADAEGRPVTWSDVAISRRKVLGA